MDYSYTLADFDYTLPPELIAQAPATTRSASRLLDIDGGRLIDRRFGDLPSLLREGDLLVFNDTKVIRARAHGNKPSGGRVEMLIERLLGDDEALVQLKASHLPKPGGEIAFASGMTAKVIERHERFFRLRFSAAIKLEAWLEEYGEMPLPPYITQPDGQDVQRYQTVYAKVPGAVAAPTAGLHFDPPTFAALAHRGIECAYVTLHVGSGTFLPVTTDDLSQHRMHSESFVVPPETSAAIAQAKARGGRVIAVGTTSLRALESASDERGAVAPGASQTSLFITPGYRFRVVDRLVTNFHLPRSTLLMLVSAFAGHETIRAAYAHAIRERYRFYSYGDAMLLRLATDKAR